VNSQLPVGIQHFRGVQVLPKYGILVQVLKYQMNEVLDLLFDMVKHPLIPFSRAYQARVLEIGEVPGSFGLGEVQDMLQIRDAKLRVVMQ
jgi:hypothetical protein